MLKSILTETIIVLLCTIVCKLLHENAVYEAFLLQYTLVYPFQFPQGQCETRLGHIFHMAGSHVVTRRPIDPPTVTYFMVSKY